MGKMENFNKELGLEIINRSGGSNNIKLLSHGSTCLRVQLYNMDAVGKVSFIQR